MPEHLADGLDGDSVCISDGGGKRVAGKVESDSLCKKKRTDED